MPVATPAQVQARVHINSFRVDAVLPFDWGDLSAVAAAASLPTGSSDGASSGTAVYLTASLFNHSCDPNVSVSFPYNDGTVVLTAADDVEAGEELHISYVDEGMSVARRREHLRFAYGFVCDCTRCQEEAGLGG
jgi:hypothetical protein